MLADMKSEEVIDIEELMQIALKILMIMRSEEVIGNEEVMEILTTWMAMKSEDLADDGEFELGMTMSLSLVSKMAMRLQTLARMTRKSTSSRVRMSKMRM